MNRERIVASRRYYYWIAARDESGKPYLIFGGDDEDTARRKGLEMLGGLDFELLQYPTMDKDAASAFFRGKRLEKTHSLQKSSQRIGHERSIARLRRRKLR